MGKIKLIALMALGFLAMGCPFPDTSILKEPHYVVHIYYKNSKGENLLDPATVGHYNRSDVILNGEASDFSIDSVSYGNTLPKGFALVFTLSKSGASTTNDIISLNANVTDTLSSKYSGSTLVGCYYDRLNVLPSNFTSPSFAVTVIK